MEISDAIIVSEIRKGNEEVFHALFEHYYPKLLQFANNFIYDKDICKDHVQEVFMALWDQRETLSIMSLKSYLFTAIRNKSLTYLRNMGIKDKHNVHLIEFFFETHDEDILEDSDILLQVKNAVNELPSEMKRIFQLKYAHDLTMNEIAEDLNISVSTVKTQLSRARQKLRTQLAKHTHLLFFI